jgi:predicted glycogen debranching enzyme
MKTTMLKFNSPSFGELSSKEWLLTNGLGGYASSSLSGANTRRYHGLLVAALNPPTGRTVMVSKVEETLVSPENGEVELSSNRYPGVVHPQGFQFLKSFERLPAPAFFYETNGCNLVKRIVMPQGSNTTVVAYENAGKTTFRLRLKPMFVHRDYHSLFSENGNFNYYEDWKTPQSAVIYAHYGAPALWFSFSKGEFKPERAWYKNFEYEKEQYRGLDYREDAFSNGSVEVELAAGEQVYLTFSLDETMSQAGPEVLMKNEITRLKRLRAVSTSSADSSKGPMAKFLEDLTIAANQFIVKRASSGGETIIAGYHWFTDWGRDTMIAMRGLVIAQGRQDLAKSIITTFLQYLDGGMLPNRFPDQGEEPEYNTLDATLWLFVVLHEYVEKFGDLDFIRSIFPQLTGILVAHIRGTRYNIHTTKEGLLFGGEGIAQLTWMDARVGDYVVTPRHGCPVEINALWYNALMIYNRFIDLLDSDEACFEELAERVKTSFKKYFWNENGRLNDVVIPGEYVDESIRPNQIYALSLPFPLLDAKEGKQVLKTVKEKLLTPLGLRSLDPEHPDFVEVYGGDQWHRDTAYHQGTVWSFLLGEYWLAFLKMNHFTEKSKAEVLAMMEPLRRHFYEEDCIHGISEIFDGGEPGAGRGCVQQAWSVGMVLKVLTDMHELVAIKQARPTKKLSLI